MAEQDTEIALEQDQPVAAAESTDSSVEGTTVDGDGEVDDSIDDLEFLIDDIEDQIAPLGL